MSIRLPKQHACLAVIALLLAATAELHAQTTAELDAFWAEVSRTVSEGDFGGYAATYHPDAVVIFGMTTQPIAAALAGWEEGFVDTAAGRTTASVDFQVLRSSKRRHDGPRNGDLSL